MPVMTPSEQRIRDALRDANKALSAHSVASASNTSLSTARSILRRMVAENEAHVPETISDGPGWPTPLYRIGRGISVDRPIKKAALPTVPRDFIALALMGIPA